MNTPEDSMRQMFEQLDAWGYLPAYRLEPRADAFFGLHMRRVVEQCVGRELHSVAIPELPLRRGTLFGETVAGGPNSSVKVDYALLATNVDAVYSVELKTDQAFRREVQDAHPLAARKAGWDEILDGVLRIVRTTAPQYHPEYRHLLAQLEKVGAICVPAEMRRATPEGILRDLSDVVTRVRPEPAIEVLYVQPRATGVKTVIDSEEFGSALPADDPVAGVFREHLARWTEPAGAVHPQHVLEEGGG